MLNEHACGFFNNTLLQASSSSTSEARLNGGDEDDEPFEHGTPPGYSGTPDPFDVMATFDEAAQTADSAEYAETFEKVIAACGVQAKNAERALHQVMGLGSEKGW